MLTNNKRTWFCQVLWLYPYVRRVWQMGKMYQQLLKNKDCIHMPNDILESKPEFLVQILDIVENELEKKNVDIDLFSVSDCDRIVTKIYWLWEDIDYLSKKNLKEQNEIKMAKRIFEPIIDAEFGHISVDKKEQVLKCLVAKRDDVRFDNIICEIEKIINETDSIE